MTKVKFFSNVNLQALEDEVNSFLADNSTVCFPTFTHSDKYYCCLNLVDMQEYLKRLNPAVTDDFQFTPPPPVELPKLKAMPKIGIKKAAPKRAVAKKSAKPAEVTK